MVFVQALAVTTARPLALGMVFALGHALGLCQWTCYHIFMSRRVPGIYERWEIDRCLASFVLALARLSIVLAPALALARLSIALALVT